MILFTSDWQASLANLPRLHCAVAQMLQVCRDRGIRTLVHAGDVKHTLNPLDGRVLNALIAYFESFAEAGITCHVLRGNHDKLGMGEEAPDFFPLLRAAGAHCYSDPEIFQAGKGEPRLFFLPYYGDKARAVGAAAMLQQRSPSRRDSVLVFHAAVAGAETHSGHNYVGEDALTPEELGFSFYHSAFGGHFHFGQQVGPGPMYRYIGSPFATDWGEANQEKGFLILEQDGARVLSSRKCRLTIGRADFNSDKLGGASCGCAPIDGQSRTWARGWQWRSGKRKRCIRAEIVVVRKMWKGKSQAMPAGRFPTYRGVGERRCRKRSGRRKETEALLIELLAEADAGGGRLAREAYSI
jgi:DNA repair exonuclease SbcCD nuclease subunit